jgi:hypothetical protein
MQYPFKKKDGIPPVVEERSISIAEFIQMIEKLPEDEPREDRSVWYRSQKQHWTEWLKEYDGPGAYHRKGGPNRDAKYAYNHIVCPNLPLYLAVALGASNEKIEQAHEAYLHETSLMAQVGAIRKVFPWSEIYRMAWVDDNPVFHFHLRPLRYIPYQNIYPSEKLNKTQE